MNDERSIPGAVATLGLDARREFLKKTYAHLFGAILAFIGVEVLLLAKASPLRTAVSEPIIRAMVTSPYGWLVVLLLFMGAGWLAQRWAMSDTSRGM